MSCPVNSVPTISGRDVPSTVPGWLLPCTYCFSPFPLCPRLLRLLLKNNSKSLALLLKIKILKNIKQASSAGLTRFPLQSCAPHRIPLPGAGLGCNDPTFTVVAVCVYVCVSEKWTTQMQGLQRRERVGWSGPSLRAQLVGEFVGQQEQCTP